MASTYRPLRLAHRGDWRRAPENTIEALQAAFDVAACDGVEIDVQLSADGVPILLHDDTLQRVQGRPERPAELSAAVLGDLGVPTL
ncbi:MAG: glycerophosphodiester phosphodiesterase family protein, partial [Chloroflexota bacterium]|nr:glycerophosphodiester phosphodiesterase family protein [Chloroflexota bacterium]